MNYRLPTTIDIGGIEHKIAENGDFRMVLNVFSVLEDASLDKQERLLLALCIFYDLDEIDEVARLEDLEEAVNGMYDFFNAGRPESKASSLRLIDWDKDSTMICSAVNQVAGKEIRAEAYIHWWTFVAYYMAVGESTMSTVVHLRGKISKGKKLEKWEREFRRENPEYFKWQTKSVEDQEIERKLFEMFNSEG